MIARVTDAKWAETRDALARTGERFAELVAAMPDAGVRATVHWSAAETAAHVATLVRAAGHLYAAEGEPAPFDRFEELMRNTVIDTVADFNRTVLAQFSERDPGALAEILRTDLDRLLRLTSGLDPAKPMSWLADSHVPVAGLLAHLLNEFQIHGRDIARAIRSPWRVPSAEAALFFDLFLIGVTSYGYGRLLEGHGPARPGRVAVEFRSKYTTPVTMAVTDGVVTTEEPGGTTDVRLSFEPVALNLMLFGRIGKARAVLTRKVAISGRRPWLMPAFERIMHLPA
jgi:hypothetical protein